MKKPENIEEYHSGFPPETVKLLEQLRAAIIKAAPKAEEVISYGMPAFKLNTVLVYYAGYKNHIGFYPTSEPIKVFKKELATYKTSKGAIQFPLDKKLPLTLIKNIVKFRVKADQEKAKAKKK